MKQTIQYDFCPYCKTLMSNGVCGCCGYSVNPDGSVSNNPNLSNYSNRNQNANGYVNEYPNPYQNPVPKKKMSAGAIIGIVFGCMVAFVVLIFTMVLGIFAITLGLIGAINETIEETENSYTYDEEYSFEDSFGESLIEEDTDFNVEKEDKSKPDETIASTQTEDLSDDELIDIDGDGVGELEFEPGLEGLNAEYYATITDYIRYDLSYSVSFLEYTDYSGNTSCYYPYLTGNQEFIDYLNQGFYMMSEGAVELASTYECEATSIPYVTYMDENVLSVVYLEMYVFDDNSYFEDIICFNFDMKTGKMIEPVVDATDEFLDILEERCLEQSTSDATYIFDTYTKDELREFMTNGEHSLVAFYTPLGMELGVNYAGYWCCATFKDFSEYVSFDEQTTEF